MCPRPRTAQWSEPPAPTGSPATAVRDPSPAAIRDFTAYAEKNVWFVSRSQDIGNAGEYLDQLGATHYDFGELGAWLFGAPTANLIRHGDMEALDAAKVDRPGIALTGPEEAYAGKHALRLHSEEAGDLQLHPRRHALHPPKSRPRPLAGRCPLGWKLEPRQDAVTATENPDGAPAVSLEPSRRCALAPIASPRTTPGNTVVLSAFATPTPPSLWPSHSPMR